MTGYLLTQKEIGETNAGSLQHTIYSNHNVTSVGLWPLKLYEQKKRGHTYVGMLRRNKK
jgi:hypothetical protein